MQYIQVSLIESRIRRQKHYARICAYTMCMCIVAFALYKLASTNIKDTHIHDNKYHMHDNVRLVKYSSTIGTENIHDVSITFEQLSKLVKDEHADLALTHEKWLNIMYMFEYYMVIFYDNIADLKPLYGKDMRLNDDNIDNIKREMQKTCASQLRAMVHDDGFEKTIEKLQFVRLIYDLYNMSIRFKKTDYYKQHNAIYTELQPWTYNTTDVRIMLNMNDHDEVNWQAVMSVIDSAPMYSVMNHIHIFTTHGVSASDHANKVRHTLYLVMIANLCLWLNTQFQYCSGAYNEVYKRAAIILIAVRNSLINQSAITDF